MLICKNAHLSENFRAFSCEIFMPSPTLVRPWQHHRY